MMFKKKKYWCDENMVLVFDTDMKLLHSCNYMLVLLYACEVISR